MDINYKGSKNGVFTCNLGVLSNDFFVDVLDMYTAWKKSEDNKNLFIGFDRDTGKEKWTATRIDLIITYILSLNITIYYKLIFDYKIIGF